MKKLIATLLIILLLSACNTSADVQNTPSPSKTPAANQKTDTPPPIESEMPGATPDEEVFIDAPDIAPDVLAQSPLDGQRMALNGSIEITFNQPMEKSVTEAAWNFTSLEGDAIEGEISWPSANVFKFLPETLLQPESEYLAGFTGNIQGTSGNQTDDEFLFSFTTVGAFAVSQVFPATASIETSVDAVITVVFNHPVVPMALGEDKDDLPNPLIISPMIEGHGDWVSTSVYVFEPESQLQKNTFYTITIPEALENITGQVLAEEYSWKFKTIAPEIDYFKIEGSYYNPRNFATDIKLDPVFIIQFEQPMEPDSVERLTTVTATSENNFIPLTFEWDETLTALTLTLDEQLDYATQYNLDVDQTAQAEGGGNLKDGLDWTFRTIPLPGIEATDPRNNSSDNTSIFRIDFRTAMNPDTLQGHITFSPEIPDLEEQLSDLGEIYESRSSIYIYGLEPDTSYTVNILPGIEDKYGTAITTGKTIKFKTLPASPYLRVHGLNYYSPLVFSIESKQEFYFEYRNIESIDLSLKQLSDKELVNIFEAVDISSTTGTQLDSWALDVETPANKRVFVPHSFQNPDAEALAPGFYILQAHSPEIKYQSYRYYEQGLVIIATHNLTMKVSGYETFVWATDWLDGSPTADLSVDFYDFEGNYVGTKSTNSEGIVKIEDSGSIYYALINDGSNIAFASRSWSGSEPRDFGISTSYYFDRTYTQAYVYTDRPLYRPGQPVNFKGIVRLNTDMDYSLPILSEVQVEIFNYDYESVFKETFTLNENGSFSGEFLLAEDTALGYYRIVVSDMTDEAVDIGSLSFNVAEYRKPEFQVMVTPLETDVLADTPMGAEIEASYYSGGVVKDGEITIRLSHRDYVFSPGGEYSRYSFIDFDQYSRDYYSNQWRSYDYEYADLDKDGKYTYSTTLDMSEFDLSQQITIDIDVKDITDRVVTESTNLTLHKTTTYVGVRAESFIGQAGEAQIINLVALNWDANPVPGTLVSVEIVKRNWYSVQEKDDLGVLRWVSTVEDISVAEFTDIVMDDNGEGQVSFSPEEGGIYRIVVTSKDSGGNTAQAASYIWIRGSGYIPWRQGNNNQFEIISDKTDYSVGDIAEIMIASPFTNPVYAWITVERGKIHSSEVIYLKDNSAVYEIPITDDLTPVAYVSVILIKGNGEEIATHRYSYAKLNVDTEKKELQVTLTPDREQASPGEDITYTVEVTDYDGNPVQAEVSLALSDLAALSLAPPNSPTPLDYFYSQTPLRIRTAITMIQNADAYNAVLEEYADGAGGGGGPAQGVFEVRGDFKDTAYWNAFVTTGADGKAEVTLSLPDNLTIWRMDARAVTKDTLVGVGTVDISSTKPLLIRPQAPRFFTAGDKVQLGAVVQNHTDEVQEVTVWIEAEGVTLTGTDSYKIEIPADDQAYITWDVIAEEDANVAILAFFAQSTAYQDASYPTLATADGHGIPIYQYHAVDVDGTSGMLTEGDTQVEAFIVPDTFSKGTLTLEVSHSLTNSMLDGFEYLKSYPYYCTEQIVSRFLPNVIALKVLQDMGADDPELIAILEEEINTSLQTLYSRQNYDGGWNWWSSSNYDDSDDYVTAYVLLGLLEAREAGYDVSDNLLSLGINFLSKSTKAPSSTWSEFKFNRASFIYYVLARAGKPNVGYTETLYKNYRNDMSIYGKAYLGLNLQLTSENNANKADLIVSEIMSSVLLSASGAHWSEETRDYWNWNTDVRTTAIVLNLLMEADADNPINPNIVRWLMAARNQGHWRSTQETVWALIGLTQWMEYSDELAAEYAYKVTLNEGDILKDSVGPESAATKESNSLTLDLESMLLGEINYMIVSRGSGTGNLYYTSFLQATVPIETLPPIDQGIAISRQYFDANGDLTTPITQAEIGDMLLVKVTITTPGDLYYVVVDDPLPAGLEATGSSINGGAQYGENFTIETARFRGYGWWYIDHVEMRDEKIVVSADYLPAGTYVITYLVRASSVGEFNVIPATAQEFYFPDVFGRGAGSLFTVTP